MSISEAASKMIVLEGCKRPRYLRIRKRTESSAPVPVHVAQCRYVFALSATLKVTVAKVSRHPASRLMLP